MLDHIIWQQGGNAKQLIKKLATIYLIIRISATNRNVTNINIERPLSLQTKGRVDFSEIQAFIRKAR